MASSVIRVEIVKEMAMARIGSILSIRAELKEKTILKEMSQSRLDKLLRRTPKTREQAEAKIDLYDLFDREWEYRFIKQMDNCTKIKELADLALLCGKKEMVLTDDDLYWLV